MKQPPTLDSNNCLPYTKPVITVLGQLSQFVREGGGGFGVDGPGELIGDKIYYPSWDRPPSA